MEHKLTQPQLSRLETGRNSDPETARVGIYTETYQAQAGDEYNWLTVQ